MHSLSGKKIPEGKQIALYKKQYCMTYPVYFISLGPGEAELITVKGLNLLRAADRIYCPATAGRNGAAVSRAADILGRLEIPADAVRPFMLPMSKDRAAAWEAYDGLALQAEADYRTGKRVAIVAEGDAGFYSSVHYVYDKLVAEGVEVKRIAGIPAFIAAGALAGLHIVRQEEELNVIPGRCTAEDLERKINGRQVVVIMKLSAAEKEVKDYMRRSPQAVFHYFENVGTPTEFYTSDRTLILEKRFPYFSLMVIRPEESLSHDSL